MNSKATTWLVARSEASFSAGETVRACWRVPPAGSGLAGAANVPGAWFSEEPNGWWVSGIVTVVSVEGAAEDDGTGPDGGGVFRAQVRAATATEAVAVLRDEPPRYKRCELLARRVGHLLFWGGDVAAPALGDVTVPDLAPLTALTYPEVPLRGIIEGPGRQLRLDRRGGSLWTVAATADRDAANCGCFVALEHPLTPEREELVRDLFAEHSALDAWCREGYTPRAAEMLYLSGWSRAALQDASALSLRATGDAQSFVVRPFSWWVEHGWTGRAGTYGGVAAAEAVRLAEAGVTYEQAAALHAAGFETLREKLAARAPRLPVTPGGSCSTPAAWGAARPPTTPGRPSGS